MPVHCQTIISALERFAPKYLAEDWDSIGLQIGNPAQEVSRVMLSLDLNWEVLEEALSQGVDMLVVHHTPLFKPLKNLRTDLPLGKLISTVVQKGLALYTAHTNLDSARGGVNDILAQKLGLEQVTLLSTTWRQKLYKLAVFIPDEYVDQVHEAISKAGAGWIWNYSDCAFGTKGTGLFRPLEGTNPYIGRQGSLEKVEETRLETILPEEYIPRVLKAMQKAHPYEEVAYDLYPLANEGEKAGLGRVGRLSQPMNLAQFIRLVQAKLGIPLVKYCGDLDTVVEKIALCGGSGASLISQAAFAGAKVYLTADIKYHEAQEALAQGLAIVDGGHFATERPVIAVLGEYLRSELEGKDVLVLESVLNTDPFRYLLDRK